MRAGGETAASRAASWISIGRARRVVVGAVVHHAGAVGVEAAEAAEPEMIVVGADDDGLVAKHRIAAREEADHVLAHQAADPGLTAPPALPWPTVNDWNQPPAAGWSPTCSNRRAR